MRNFGWVWVWGIASSFVLSAGCGEVRALPDAGGGGVDAAAPACDPAKPFKAPVVLASVSSPEDDGSASLSADERTMYLSTRRSSARSQIFVATRDDRRSAFSAPVPLDPVNIGDSFSPSATADDLTLYLISNGLGSVGGGHDVFVARRSNPIAAFDAPMNVANINHMTDIEFAVSVTGSGDDLFFHSDRSGVQHIWHAARSGAGFGAPSVVAELSDATHGESTVAVRADGLEIYFASARSGTIGGPDIWMARRTSTSDPFGALKNVTELNSSQADYPSWISADGCRVLFASSRAGGAGSNDIWFAERPE
jgi:hypothetical protein